MKSVCYLDLDGVLVDFVGGALKVHGKTLSPDSVRWNFHEQIEVTPEEFWKPFGYHFWCKLGWTVEGPILLNLLERIFGEDIVLMTSPCETEGSVEGKVDWIKTHLPNYKRKFFVGPAKHLAAGPTKILVDDHEGNTDKFISRHGKAVLVPRPWNRLIGETNDRGQFDVYRVIEAVKGLIR